MEPVSFNDRIFEEFPELRTPRLFLRRHLKSDDLHVFRIHADKRVRQYSGKEVFQSMAEAKHWLRGVEESWESREGVCWALESVESKEYLGDISFWRILKQHRRAELGYKLSAEQWGKGYMHEAMKVVLDFGFKKMRLHSVEANVTPENKASIALLLKNGFVQEGYFKENFYGVQEFLDTASFSLRDSVA
jgi:ribosomal-protein-alanine N-acetyltransferase